MINRAILLIVSVQDREAVVVDLEAVGSLEWWRKWKLVTTNLVDQVFKMNIGS